MIIKPIKDDSRNALLPHTPGPGANTAQATYFMVAFPLQFQVVKGAVATFTALDYFEVLGRNQLAIQVSSSSGPFSASVLVEATLDGIKWFTLDTIAAEGIKQYSGIYAAIRVSIPSYTTGTIDVFAISQKV